MRVVLTTVAILLLFGQPVQGAAGDVDREDPQTVTQFDVQEGDRVTQWASAGIQDMTEGGGTKNGGHSRSIGAQRTCRSLSPFGPTIVTLPDEYENTVVVDPMTGEHHTQQIFVRRSIRLILECQGHISDVVRCIFGLCPPPSETLPDMRLLMRQALDTSDYEIPEPLFSPAVRPGKVPIPGLPFYFAVPQAQWDRVVDAHAVACNGILCAYAHVSAKVIGVRFNPGEGAPIICRSAGVVVRSAEQFRSASRLCSFTYQKSARYAASLSLMYDVTAVAGVIVQGVRQRPLIGPERSRLDVTRRLTIPVTEYQPVIIK